jgi:hypothetical protein
VSGGGAWWQWFRSPEFLSTLSLTSFSPAVLASQLHTVLPRHWKGQPAVAAYSAGAAGQGLPSVAWLRGVWAFLGESGVAAAGGAGAQGLGVWPLVPLTTGELAAFSAVHYLINLPHPLPELPEPLSPDAAAVAPPLFDFMAGGGDDDSAAAACAALMTLPALRGLLRLGVAIIHPAFARHLPRCDGAGGLARAALAALQGPLAARTAAAAAAAGPLDMAEARALFALMGQVCIRAVTPFVVSARRPFTVGLLGVYELAGLLACLNGIVGGGGVGSGASPNRLCASRASGL